MSSDLIWFNPYWVLYSFCLCCFAVHLMISTLGSGCGVVKGCRRWSEELVSNCTCTQREGRRSSFESERRWRGRGISRQRAGWMEGWFGRLCEGGTKEGGWERERDGRQHGERGVRLSEERLRQWCCWWQKDENLRAALQDTTWTAPPDSFCFSSSCCCFPDERVRFSSRKSCDRLRDSAVELLWDLLGRADGSRRLRVCDALLQLVEMPVMKGLLAPQNTFLDTITNHFDGTRKCIDCLHARWLLFCTHDWLWFKLSLFCFFFC